MKSSLTKALTELLGSQRVLTEPIDILPYGFDGTAALKGDAGCVVLPRTTEEVASCIRLAAEGDVPIVCRGSGTGLSGGSVPVKDCLVLCTVEMTRVLELDPENLTIRVEPGVITQHIDQLAAEHGLFYPPDPGSNKISTIGGNVAENSGGLRGLKYGVTRDYVLGLRVALIDGRVVWLGSGCVKDVAGYNLRDLFIGSEGTLGVVTEILLKLLPRPSARGTMTASFACMESAAQAVSDIIARHITPCTLEFLDRTTIRCVEEYASVGLPTEAEALLLVESDGHPSIVEQELSAMRGVIEANHATRIEVAQSEEEAERLRMARRTAFSALARRRPTTILEDVTVPRNRLAEMVKYVNDVAKRHRVEVGVFGHMGDGNLHPTFLTDERNEEEMHRVESALEEIVIKTIELGGTTTGEHGVGVAKKKFLSYQYDDASLELLRQVKATLDPRGLMNPGKIFDMHVEGSA